jgi:hypothetical protein
MSSTPLEALLPNFNFSGFPVEACSKIVDETLRESEQPFCVVLCNTKGNLAEIRLLRPLPILPPASASWGLPSVRLLRLDLFERAGRL